MINKKNAFGLLFLGIFLFTLNLINAVVIEDVTSGDLFPGTSTSIKIIIKNTLDDPIENVALTLDLEDTSFTTIGSSEDSEEEIKENDKESFDFVIKASSSISPGDYNIPYILKYKIGTENFEKIGSFGVTVGAKTELSYSIETEKNIIGEKGKIFFKVINTGLGDIRFVYVKISGTGFDLLSPNEEYLGRIDSDDFEKATFDVIFKNENAKISAFVEYKDFYNNIQSETINLPVKVYSREKALELGLLQKNNTLIYFGLVGFIIVAWIVYRSIKKSRKNKNSGR